MGEANRSVHKALTWLGANQMPTGELPAWASPLDQGDPIWLPDSLKFITALATTALATIPDPEAEALVARSIDFLRSEREPRGLWRYWSRSNDQYGFTPPDADDTACCSMAVSTAGDDTSENIPMLMANRDDAGRFRTWFVPHRGVRGFRWWRAMREERTPEVMARRAELWSTTEAEADDVDVVVNANVCRYLGAAAPHQAAAWVASTLRDGVEVGADKWHRNATTFYLSVADGARRGVREFADLEAPVADGVERRWRAGQLTDPLDLAQSLLALQAFAASPTMRADIARSLVATQADDGSWARSIFFYGGPEELFGWASEAMTTAYAAAALHAEGWG